MTEYWVSKSQYFCKYCEIYIRVRRLVFHSPSRPSLTELSFRAQDDKPSRQQHETGLRHKGNVERYIRSVYKNAERRDRDKAVEAREIARIESAAAAAHAKDHPAPPPPPPTASTSTKKLEKWTGGSNVGNYSDARSLGLVDEAELEQAVQVAEEQAQEGRVGEWTAVSRRPARSRAPVASGSGTRDGEGEQEEPEDHLREDERPRPPHRMFGERSALAPDDEDDAPLEIKLKRKRPLNGSGPLTGQVGAKKDEAGAEAGEQVHGTFKGFRLDGKSAPVNGDAAAVKADSDVVDANAAGTNGSTEAPSSSTGQPIPSEPETAAVPTTTAAPAPASEPVEDAKPTIVNGASPTEPVPASATATGGEGASASGPVFKKRKGNRVGQARSTGLM